MQTEQEKLYSKIRYQIMSWYLDEGDYQPTEEEAKTKSIQAISFCLASQKQKMGEMISTIDTKAHACLFNDGEQSKNPYCDCYLEALSDIKQRINEL